MHERAGTLKSEHRRGNVFPYFPMTQSYTLHLYHDEGETGMCGFVNSFVSSGFAAGLVLWLKQAEDK